MLEATNLSFRIGPKMVVDQLSLQVQCGEVLAVVGPNGAGKSTLLKLLTGDLKPSAGQIYLMQRPLTDWTRPECAMRRAVLLQNSTLTFAFTVREVVLMGRIPHNNGVERARDEEIARAALDKVGLLPLAERFYPTLSGGEQQRVQLARILTQIWEKPPEGDRYLFLDEPTANLDLAYQHQTLRAAREFANQGTAVLIILHDLNLAAQYADRLLMIKQGRPYFCGTPHEVLTRQAIHTVFDIPAVVMPHPELDCPLVVPTSNINS